MRVVHDLILAFQFLTRIPVPGKHHGQGGLSGAVKFFPVVGLVIALGAIGLRRTLINHLPPLVVAVLVLAYLVVITGGFHEDGLADSADGFGGGWTKEKILEIMRDSRIGSFGALAIGLSLLARYSLLSSLSTAKFSSYIVVALVLSRWTTLPLSYFMQPARTQGQGAGVMQTSILSLILGTIIAVVICYFSMHLAFWLPAVAAAIVTALSAAYYQKQIGGITGDCFGATNQLSEIAIYICGVWAA